jgi:CRP-like cAMP-binding protein
MAQPTGDPPAASAAPISERERFLQRVPLFGDLDAEELRALADVSHFVRFPDSALIFREGETGDCAYVVVRGSVQVFATDRNGDELVLAQLREFEHVGEQSLLHDDTGRRNASLRACEDTTLLRIPIAEFQAILSQRPTLGDLLSETGRQQHVANVLHTSRLSRIWALFMFVNGFVSIAILTGLARLFDTPFIFPTLGAVAFLVFFTPTTAPASPRNALCGNAVAIACGYGALVATGLQHAGPATDAHLGWARVLAVSLALAATSALMILLNIPHPPAAATAMFVALGAVTKPAYLLVLEAAVALLVLQAIVINRLTGVRYPLWSRVPAPQIGNRAGRTAAHRVARLFGRIGPVRHDAP